MPIEGPLHELGIHDVFHLLDLGRKTGRLRITSEVRQRGGTICVEGGAVIGAAVDDAPFDLAAVLLRAGRIGPEEHKVALEWREAGDARPIGEILVSLGAVSHREIERQVRRHTEETVFELMGWSEGYFVFEEMPCGLPPTEVPVRIAIEELLMEGARRIDEWSRMASLVPGVDVVPDFRTDLDPGTSLGLTPFEWEVMAAIDGRSTVAEIAAAVGRAEFDVARALFGLASGGVILLHASRSEAPEQADHGGVDAMIAVAESRLEADDLAGAIDAARAAANLYPGEARAHLVLGRALAATRAFDDAAAALTEALRLDPDLAAAARWLGLAEAGRGRFQAALAAWDRWAARPRPEEAAHGEQVRRWREAAGILARAMESST
ncbi:MAG: DUF4388 domain-containing protein [Gemmatimonadota bacterium]